MILYHATPTSNVNSILADGILASRARGSLRAVWLHKPSLTAWAIIHTCRRHNVKPDEVSIIEVSVPHTALRRASRRGLWRTAVDVDVDTPQIVSHYPASLLDSDEPQS